MSQSSLPSSASQSSATSFYTARDSLPSSASQSSATESGYETDIYTDSEEIIPRVNDPKYLLYVLRTLVIKQNLQHEIDESHILAILDKLHNNAKSKRLLKTALTYLYLILTKENLPRELTSTEGVQYVDERGIIHHPDQKYKDISEEDTRIFDEERRIAIEQEEEIEGDASPLDIENSIIRLFARTKRVKRSQRSRTNGARGHKRRSRKQSRHKTRSYKNRR